MQSKKKTNPILISRMMMIAMMISKQNCLYLMTWMLLLFLSECKISRMNTSVFWHHNYPNLLFLSAHWIVIFLTEKIFLIWKEQTKQKMKRRFALILKRFFEQTRFSLVGSRMLLLKRKKKKNQVKVKK